MSDATTKQYRKTALIRAVQWQPGLAVEGVCECGHGNAAKAPCDKRRPPHVHTLEGTLAVSPGDWIATGVKGEHWPIKPDVFAASYESADGPSVDALAEREATIARLREALRELCMALQHPDYFRAGTGARERLQDAYDAAEKVLADSPPHAALDAALVQARREAAEAMREACARVASSVPVADGRPGVGRLCRVRENIVAAIRDEPLPDGEKEPAR